MFLQRCFFEVCLLGCKRGRAMVDQLGGTVSKDFSKCQLSPRYKPFALSLLNLTFYSLQSKNSGLIVYVETCEICEKTLRQG